MEARALAVFRDVTRERAVVEDLEAFAATVAHDLRGPLSGVRGWAELVLQLLAHPGTLSPAPWGRPRPAAGIPGRCSPRPSSASARAPNGWTA